MKVDHPVYLVVVNHPGGPYIRETDIADTALVKVCKDLRDGQYEDVLAVLECSNVRDATHDFKDIIPKD
jgi:hypothetical protein